MNSEPFFVVSLHFPELNRQLHDALYERFRSQIWHRLRSHGFLPEYIQVGVRCATLQEAMDIGNEYRDGFHVMTEIAVEGWSASTTNNVIPLTTA